MLPLFAGGAAYLLFVPEKEEVAEGEEEADSARRGMKTVGTAFLVIFVGEFGDLTQILTANLAANYHAPAEVFIGAFAGLASSPPSARWWPGPVAGPSTGCDPQGRRRPAWPASPSTPWSTWSAADRCRRDGAGYRPTPITGDWAWPRR